MLYLLCLLCLLHVSAGLNVTLHRAINEQGALPSGVILGLPAYGRVFTCDGDDTNTADGGDTADGDDTTNDISMIGKIPICNCKEKNFKKRSLDLLAAVPLNVTKSCTTGYDDMTATPWWDCPRGSGLPGGGDSGGIRQQGWYENFISLNRKSELAKKYGCEGLGLWTANGISDGTMEDGEMWKLFSEWR